MWQTLFLDVTDQFLTSGLPRLVVEQCAENVHHEWKLVLDHLQTVRSAEDVETRLMVILSDFKEMFIILITSTAQVWLIEIPSESLLFFSEGCGVELTSTAREVKSRPGIIANKVNQLFCLRCHDQMNIPICGACRRPIEERVVTALGKHWHVEHFACARCEKPFLGHQHYERNGLAYCQYHYHQLFGQLCYHCNGVIKVEKI